MKFACTKSNLVRGLSVGERIPGRNVSLPVLENILLKSSSDNRLNIISTDLELGVSVWIPAKIEEEGEVTVPLRLTMGLTQAISEGNIQAQTQKQTLALKSGGVTSKINGGDAAQFPVFPTVTQKNPITVPAQQFALALSSVIHSVSLQETKPELTGIFVTFSPKEIICAATDTFRLAEKKITPATSGKDKSFSQGNQQNVILPLKTAQEIVRIFQQDTTETPLTCFIQEGQVLFTYTPDEQSIIPETHIVSRVIEGEYPDYQQIIPKQFTSSLIIKKHDILSAAKSSSLFTNRLREVFLVFSPKEQTCTVKTHDPDKGEYSATLSCEGEGDEVRVVLNYQYLMDGITHITDGEVRVRLQDSLKPVLFSSSIESTPYLYVVMPIQKNE